MRGGGLDQRKSQRDSEETNEQPYGNASRGLPHTRTSGAEAFLPQRPHVSLGAAPPLWRLGHAESAGQPVASRCRGRSTVGPVCLNQEQQAAAFGAARHCTRCNGCGGMGCFSWSKRGDPTSPAQGFGTVEQGAVGRTAEAVRASLAASVGQHVLKQTTDTLCRTPLTDFDLRGGRLRVLQRDVARCIGKTKSIFAPASSGARPPEHPSATCWRTRLTWVVHACAQRGAAAPYGAHRRKGWGGAARRVRGLDTRRRMV